MTPSRPSNCSWGSEQVWHDTHTDHAHPVLLADKIVVVSTICPILLRRRVEWIFYFACLDFF